MGGPSATPFAFGPAPRSSRTRSPNRNQELHRAPSPTPRNPGRRGRSPLAALPAQAQGPEKGDYSFAVLLFTNTTGSRMEVGRQWFERLYGGLELEVREASIEDEPSDPTAGVRSKVASSDFLVGPVVRWYGEAVGPVIPFLRARVAVGWGDETFRQASEIRYTEETFEVAGSLAVGAEWFPMRQVSFSGHTGLAISRLDRERILDTGATAERTVFNSGTFVSALSIRFYFR